MHREVTSLRMEFSGQGSSSRTVAPWWFALSLLRHVSHFGTVLPNSCFSALLLWSVHSVLILFPGSGVSGMGAARAEEPWRCSACTEWLDLWINALLIQGDQGTQESSGTKHLLCCLACSLLLFRTELFPANTPPSRLTDTIHSYLMGPRGDVGPCTVDWLFGEKQL